MHMGDLSNYSETAFDGYASRLSFSNVDRFLHSCTNTPDNPLTPVINITSIMATVGDMASKEDAVYENEYAKTKEDFNFKGVPADKQQLYLSYAAKDDEWKAYHTKKLLRKVDVRLLPLLVLMYLLNFLDRSNLAQARLGTLEKDLGMKGTDFNLATSILFVVSHAISLYFEGSKIDLLPRAIYSCSFHQTCSSLEYDHRSTLDASWRCGV